MLVITSNLGPISHHFQDMVSFPFLPHPSITPNLKMFLLQCQR